MSTPSFQLSATLLSSRALGSLRVEAWDAEGLCPDLVEVAASDARGAFEMRIDAATLKELLPRRRPAVVFRVFDEDGKMVPLDKEVAWEITMPSTRLQIPLAVDGARDATGGATFEPAPLTVRGTVRDADGKPVPNVVVHAVDRQLSGPGLADTRLGSARTNAQGEYSIHYQTGSANRVKPDLVVWSSIAAPPEPDPEDAAVLEAVTLTLTESAPNAAAALARVESPLLSPAPATARVDLAAGAAASPTRSEYRRLLARLNPVLARAKSTLADLDKDALAHVARVARVRPARVLIAKQAAVMERETGGAIPAEAFYGLLRTGFRGGMAGLATMPVPQLRRRLVRAIRGHIMAETFRSQLDEIAAQFQQIVVERELPVDTTGETAVGMLLRHSLASRDSQRAFFAKWAGRDRNGRHFWSSIRKDTALAAVSDDLELTLRLGMLFDDHQPALADIKRRRQAGNVASLRDLARWEDADWQAFLERIGGAPPSTPGASAEERAATYVANLRKRLHHYHPSEALRRRARAPRDPIALRFVPTLAAANPNLDPKQPLPDAPEWGEVAEADREAARTEWASFRREALTFRGVPTRWLLDASATRQGRNPVREAASSVLAASDLDLESESIEAYLARKPETLSAVDPALRGSVVDHLKTNQRLLRITGEPEAIEMLMADGLDSALRITRLSRQQFVDRYATGLGGETQAQAAYTRSLHTAAIAQLALTTTAQSLVEHSPLAVRASADGDTKSRHQSVLDLLKSKTQPSGAPADDAGAASWPVLFGEQAWCECEDCQSVFSPAAYLVDLLHTLDPAGEEENAANHLFRRRPDLPHLKLSCENTQTTIPSIDLVNEILETYIDAQDHPAVRARTFDNGDLTSEELRALPQNVNDRVYQKLSAEVYPFTLPFHRPLAVVRSYLAQLGTSYRDVLEAFGPAEGAADLHADERVSAETLGLSVLEFQLIAGVSTFTTAACYGFADTDSDWQTTIADVPELMRRTGVSYEDLLELVKTWYVNPLQFDAAQRIELDAPVGGVLEGTRVHRADAAAWDRLHRFIRLWRACGWSIADLDRALFAVTDPSVANSDDMRDRDILRRIGLVNRAAEDFKQPLASLLALWSDIDTWGADALYLKLFRNRTIVGADDADSFALAYADTEHESPDPNIKPETGRNELVDTSQRLAAHETTILAALRVSETDLGLIWDHAISVGQLSDRETDELNLHSLTVLYRYTVLAKAVGLRIPDLITLLTLTGGDANPFQPYDPMGTRRFAELVEKVKASGFPIATLDYLFRHAIIPAQGPAPADSRVVEALMKVWAALRAVRQETEVIDDPEGALLRARLATVHPSDVVESIMNALDPTAALSDAERERIFADHLSPYLGTPLPSPLTGEAVLAGLSTWMRDSLSRSAVVSVLAESLALDDALTRRLLEEWMPGDTTGTTALDTFLMLGGAGLRAERFDGATYTGSSTTEENAVVDLSVTSTSTPRSVHWTGQLLPLGDGDHVFVLRTNASATVTITTADQTITFNAASQSFVTDSTHTVALSADTVVTIEVHFDAGADAGSIQLLWRLADQPAAVPVAPEYLFTPGGLTVLDADGIGPGFTWRRMHKAALLIQGFSLTEEEVAYAEDDHAPFFGFELGSLPMALTDDSALHMLRWERLADFAAVRASLPHAETTLVDVFLAQNAAADPKSPSRAERWANLLCEATGWDPAIVVLLFDRTALEDQEWSLRGDQVLARLLRRVAGPVADPQDLQLGRRLDALDGCLALVRRIGVDPHTWAQREPTAAMARDVVQAVAGRYDEEADWLEVARTRNDPLRESQRDALVAYLLPRMTIDGHPPADANELFEHFLIDVEMAACFQTSRIKQAISSVQLFIQRCLLGLEKPSVQPSVIDAERWPWMSRYRVWEANRKIFLYPENWIEPELRTTKSPFFEELESALKQGPLEDDNVEDAFLAYLGKLDDVSRLLVMATHHQKESDEDAPDNDIDILHVVARTPTVPTVFYYRQLVNSSEWTAWQKIDVDIETEDNGSVHMALTTHDRRLFLFWASFTEIPEDEQPGATEGESPPKPLTYWDIKLSWSTYRNGAWAPKRVSGGSIRSDRFIDKDQAELYEEWGDLADEVAELKEIWDAAENKVDTKKDALWNTLEDLRDELKERLRAVMTAGGTLDLANSLVETILATALPNFFEGDDLDELEEWLRVCGKPFEDFVADIYAYPGESFWFDVPKYTVTESDVLEQFEKLEDARDASDEAKSDYKAMNKDYETVSNEFIAAPIPKLRRRSDHTLWVTSGDTLVVSVLRRSKAGETQNIGAFTLSSDHHSLVAKKNDDAPIQPLGNLVPEHSVPRLNAYRIHVVDDDGLDLPGLPNLLGDVYDTRFLGEHDLSASITGSHPRPFFVSKGSECHVALPVPEPRTFALASDMASAPQSPFALMTDSGVAYANGTGGKCTFDLSKSLQIAETAEPVFRFRPFHHPFTRSLVKRLNRDGIDGLLTVKSQNPTDADDGSPGGHFDTTFAPDAELVESFSSHDIDFRADGAYSLYNWELFFHGPMLVAVRLMQDQRFKEARDWFHYVFDPTTDSKAEVPKRYWKVQPFRNNDDYTTADAFLTALCDPAADPTLKSSVEAQLDQWLRYPADAHRIATLRPSAYQKAVVFRYLDNLIAWGDSLFLQDTIESINEATQLYVLAGHLLGPRPENVPRTTEVTPLDYATMRDSLDDLSNLLVDVESLIFPFGSFCGADTSHLSSLLGITHLQVKKTSPDTATSTTSHAGSEQTLYFCVPTNDKLRGYWDTVEDRLFKIRHCMNIEGVERQLALFEPPIDPALLVRAAAAGLDIGSVLSDLSAPLPHHRFPLVLQKALELCAEVKSLGSQLLGALEKKDAEQLALLRATHENTLLRAVRELREKQLDEAKAQRVALDKSEASAQARYDYYSSREKVNLWEEMQVEGTLLGAEVQAMGALMSMGAAAAAAIPDFDCGPTGMGAHGTAKYGGSAVANAIGYTGEAMVIGGQALHTASGAAGIVASQERRMDDWLHQADLAKRELAHIAQQQVAADLRIEIATLEQANTDKQIEHAAAIEEVLRDKYTNEQLYSWMITRVSEVYYQAYKLAYDLAKRAERCFRFETGQQSSSFIQFGYWDSLKKGLLAGEQLALSLKRLDSAYLGAARRDYEITRNVSLVLHDPEAFMKLRETGSCEVNLREELFDADYPGHYFRRLKTVSVTLPCVAGPHTPINCTLTLLSSRVRISPSAADDYPERDTPNDSRFAHDFGSIQSVATSHGQNDAGLFEVNFRDERYLPFEGAGAISTWRIDLPKMNNAFDFDTLSDVILRLNYTARDGGTALAEQARNSLATRQSQIASDNPDGVTPTTPLRRLFRVRYEFSDKWIAFRNALTAGSATLRVTLDNERFPFLFRGRTIKIVGLRAYGILSKPSAQATLTITSPQALAFASTTEDSTLLVSESWQGEEDLNSWKFEVSRDLPIDDLKDLLLLVTYTVQSPTN